MNRKSLHSTTALGGRVGSDEILVRCKSKYGNSRNIVRSSLHHMALVPILAALFSIPGFASDGLGQIPDQDVADYVGYVRGVSHLNVRSGPAMRFSVVGILDTATPIIITHHNNRGWAKISTVNGDAAYVSMKYISRDSSLPAVDLNSRLISQVKSGGFSDVGGFSDESDFDKLIGNDHSDFDSFNDQDLSDYMHPDFDRCRYDSLPDPLC